MYPQERYEKILNLIEKTGFVRAAELNGLFSVSSETIRRDLENLEKEGFIKRVHGGAKLEKSNKKYPAFNYREKEYEEEKQEIAENALSHIKEGDSLALDCGTTTLELAKKLTANFKTLTILTNSLKVLNVLSEMENYTIILAGGVFKKNEYSLFGEMTEDNLGRFRIDTAFISASGISLEEGITDLRFDELQTQKKMLEISRNKNILATSSNFDNVCLLNMCDISRIDRIITDSELSEELYTKYTSAGIDIVK